MLGEWSKAKNALDIPNQEWYNGFMMNTTKNTGTCPCCFGQYVVKKGLMVLHGYKRPGIGYIIGNCPATRRFKPYEVSSEGTVYMLDLAKNALRGEKAMLKKLRADEIPAFTRDFPRDGFYSLSAQQKRHMSHEELYETITFKKGDGQSHRGVDYLSCRENAIRKAEAAIRGIEGDIRFLNEKIAAWKPVDLAVKQEEQAAEEAEAAKDLCPGSGTTDHDRSRMRYAFFKGGKCNHCGRFVTASKYGIMRKHPKVVEAK